MALDASHSGQWKVVDANTLRRVGLLPEFLQASRNNVAVITDFCCMECYQGDVVRTLASSLGILRRSTDQVVILKSAGEIALLSARRPTRGELIDWDQTRGFAQFCEQAAADASGDESFAEMIRGHSVVAKAYFEKLEGAASGMGQAMKQVAKELPSDLTKRLRSGVPLTPEDIVVLLEGIGALAHELFAHHPEMIPPNASSLPVNSFPFRYALAVYLLTIDWAAMGGIEVAPPSKLKNDVIDMNYVAMGTLFDGVVSSDKKVNAIYEASLLFIDNVFGSGS